MSERPKPPKQSSKAAPPSKGPWLDAARELATNPDSPISLRIISAMNTALRPAEQAVRQLIEALAQQQEKPNDASDEAVRTVIEHWQAATGAQMTNDLLEQMRNEVAERVGRRRRQPPRMESIVGDVDKTDVGYDLGIHLEGLRGTWHRLWALLALRQAYGAGEEHDHAVAVVRAQFESQLGRSLSTAEWDALVQHAVAHGATMPNAG